MPMMGMPVPRATLFTWSDLLKSRWAWCLCAVLLICLRELASNYQGLLTSLGDSDDATRLYEVRTLLGGASWFDMTLPRLGGPTPLISHWSRLIDLPLAVLLSLFGLLVTPTAAELAVRILWPILVLFTFLYLLVREAEWHAGAAAVWLLLFLGVTSMTGLSQFRLGRIDHHNVMIMFSIAGLLVLLRGRLEPRQGYRAGTLIGIGLAVGYEPLIFIMTSLCAAALIAVIDVRWLTGVRNMAVAMTATLALIFVATVAPSLWFVARCDALSLNMIALVGAGTVGLEIVNRLQRSWTPIYRIAAIVAAGSVGVALFGAFDPRCLTGPFGQVDAAIKPVWLDLVTETWSVFASFLLEPSGVASFVMVMAAGTIAAVERWRRLRTPESVALVALMLIVIPPALWMVKLAAYAVWIAVFCLALSIADLRAIGNWSALTVQLFVALLLNQTAMVTMLAPALKLARVTPATETNESKADGVKCLTTAAVSTLAPLPKGRFVGDIDLGPFIVALTQHDALAAPYHRIDQAILANQAILAAGPAQAKQLLHQAGADYLVLCVSPTDKPANQDAASGSINARLRAGQQIDYLEPIALEKDAAELHVWRVLQ